MKSIDHLRALVSGLDSAYISSWQSTEKWQTQLDAARDFLEEQTEERENNKLIEWAKHLESENSRLREIVNSNFETIQANIKTIDLYERLYKLQEEKILSKR